MVRIGSGGRRCGLSCFCSTIPRAVMRSPALSQKASRAGTGERGVVAIAARPRMMHRMGDRNQVARSEVLFGPDQGLQYYAARPHPDRRLHHRITNLPVIDGLPAF
jgi:hypothetical protein